MPAITLTTMPTFEMIGFRKYHEPIFKVVINL